MFLNNKAFWIAAQTNVIPIAWGDPGVGKTRSAEAFARATKRRCVSVSLSQHEPSDIGGYPRAERDTNSVGYVEFVMPKFLYDCKYPSKRTEAEAALGFPEYPKTILFIDELTTCQPSTQGAALRLMTHAADYLGEDTWVLSAANPPGCAANGFPLELPMANRLYHHEWEIDVQDWSMKMLEGFPDGEYPILPESWKNYISKSRAFVTGFLSKYGTWAQQLPKKNGDSQDYGRAVAWPSLRSWDNASILLAAANSLGYEANKDNISPVCAHLLEGCVGHNATHKFFEWKQAVIFPSFEETKKLIQDGKLTKSVFPDKRASDKVMAYLGTIFSDVAERPTEENIQTGWKLFELACDYGSKDIAVALKPQIFNITKKFLDEHNSKNKTKKTMGNLIGKNLLNQLSQTFDKTMGQ